MRRLRRARRPLIALIVLVLALIIGYVVRETRGHGSSHHGAAAVMVQAVGELRCPPPCR